MKHLLICLLLVAMVVGMPVGCEVWRWHECRSVGHGVFYCVTEIGK